jgi:hypothetical protein
MKSSSTVVLMIVGAMQIGCAKKAEAPWDAMGPAVLTVTADGVQIYRCVVGKDGHPAWEFKAPQADLFDDKHQGVGTHSKGDTGPQWDIGGDTIVGTKVHERAAGRMDAIPELQLSGKCTGNRATFDKVVAIERLDTEGGVAPSADGHKVGDEVRVPYKARYVFHSSKS